MQQKQAGQLVQIPVCEEGGSQERCTLQPAYQKRGKQPVQNPV